MSLNDRMDLMRQNSKVDDNDVEEYRKTELVRKSVNDVKLRAAVEKERRESPRKTYANVKSKIAGNMKSQKKAKKMNALVQDQASAQEQILMGNYGEASVRSGSPLKSLGISPRKGEASPERTAAIDRKRQEIEELKQSFADRRTQPSFSGGATTTSYNMTTTVSKGGDVRDFTAEAGPRQMNVTQYSVHEVTETRQEPNIQSIAEAPAKKTKKASKRSTPVANEIQSESTNAKRTPGSTYKS